MGKDKRDNEDIGQSPRPKSLPLKFISTQSKSRKLQMVLTDPREMLPGKEHKDNLHVSETSASQLHSRARKQHNVQDFERELLPSKIKSTLVTIT